MIRIKIESVPESELRRIPRSTLWRARKRGYYCPRYHEQWVNREAQPAPSFDHERAYKDARHVVTAMIRRGYPFPSYMGRDDLIQECIVELWRIGGKDGACMEKIEWRKKVMRNRLFQISKIVRGDRDKSRRETPDQGESESTYNDRLSLLLAEAKRRGEIKI